MSVSTDGVPDHRPARTTPNMGFTVPGGDDGVDYISDWGGAADQMDVKIPAALAAGRQVALPYGLLLGGM